jgi:hypothetical protein
MTGFAAAAAGSAAAETAASATVRLMILLEINGPPFVLSWFPAD